MHASGYPGSAGASNADAVLTNRDRTPGSNRA